MRDKSLPTRWLLIVPTLAAAVVWAYWPSLAAMRGRWSSDPQYSHGYVVPLFAIALLYLRRGILTDAPLPTTNWWANPLGSLRALIEQASAGPPLQPSWWGLAPLAVGAGLRLAGA